MKLPARIKVGGHWIKVELISEKQVQYDKMGTVCHWENRIIIQKDLVESKRIAHYSMKFYTSWINRIVWI